ncbi:hypothetical protein BMS3Abin08_00304 [bacterium BMS3Abin08]|nr:hypothetical protein BMS3Abin08_00304 [bacterium BMS3Abin08]
MILPSYKGSTLRGGFGHAFRRVVCAIKSKECPACILKERCVYSYIFETPPPPDTKIMRKYRAAPHPFVIEPPPERRRGYKPGDEITFGLTLIGRAIDYLPYFIYTFDELGRIGLGKGKAKYELMTVKTIPALAKGGRGDLETSGIIYDSKTKTLKTFIPQSFSISFNHSDSSPESPHSHLTLSFETPARIVYNGHLTIDLEFHILIRNLMRRLSLLSYFHCNSDPSVWDFKGIIKKAQEVKVSDRALRWHDWERYSARQDSRMKMGGFTGEIAFEGDIQPFMDLIRAGEVLHVGKGTSFGLGKYGIVRDVSE